MWLMALKLDHEGLDLPVSSQEAQGQRHRGKWHHEDADGHTPTAEMLQDECPGCFNKSVKEKGLKRKGQKNLTIKEIYRISISLTEIWGHELDPDQTNG